MTDEKIIELYWQRSETAIEETDRAYGRYFRSVAYGILWDNEDAEETVNDAYLKAWNTIPPEYPNYLKVLMKKTKPNSELWGVFLVLRESIQRKMILNR